MNTGIRIPSSFALSFGAHCPRRNSRHRLSMNFSIADQVHATVFTPASVVLSLVYADIPRILFASSLAQLISHFCPLEAREFSLTSTITPSDLRIRVLTLSFHSLS